jgi:hypothetical protein
LKRLRLIPRAERKEEVMHRECCQCHQPFTAQDFVKEESHEMEAERKALRLEGVRFICYSCPGCGDVNIFVDIHHLEGETPEEFDRRKADLEAAARQVRGEKTAVVITER